MNSIGHPLNSGTPIRAKRSAPTVLHVATIHKPIRPDLGYGPIETVIYNIDRELRLSGSRSIVACSAGSSVAGEQYITVERSLGDYCREETPEQRALVTRHLSKALERGMMGDIDVIHMHGWLERICEGLFKPNLPIVMTLHVPAADSGMTEAQKRRLNTMLNPSVHFVSTSEYQERQYGGLASLTTVHHGINVDDYPFADTPEKQNYLFMIGRLTRDKGQDKAIELAERTGLQLIIAGCVQDKRADLNFFEGLRRSIDLCVDIGRDPVDEFYYDKVMKPLVSSGKQIIYIGELSSEQKKQWYRHARTTLFPIQWGEPFGLVLLESMACGTPVLAFNKGAVPEIVVDGTTGFTVDSVDDMIPAIDRIALLDPAECRRHVQNHFSASRMARSYSELYRRIINGRGRRQPEARTRSTCPAAPHPVPAARMAS